MIAIGVRIDTDDLASRVHASIRHFGNRRFVEDLTRLMVAENEHHALRGLDRHGRTLSPPWRVRKGRSGYHGRRYEAYTNPTSAIPFGRDSRRIDAFRAVVSRRRLAGIGFGAVTIDAGFDARAGRVPQHWKARGWDVLGMPPRTRRAVGLLCTRHASAGHALLRRGGAIGRSASRAAAAIGL